MVGIQSRGLCRTELGPSSYLSGCSIFSLTFLLQNAANLIPWHVLLVTLRTMCDNAWAWAKERGLWRKNPMHKEEECRLVIDDEFKYNTHQGHSSEQAGSFEMEVGVLSL